MIQATAFRVIQMGVLSLVCWVWPLTALGQQAHTQNAGPALCKNVLPPEVRTQLEDQFGSWKIQEPADLSPSARERWSNEKPLQCPGIAVGRFEQQNQPSYAVLLVHRGGLSTGYKLLVFSRNSGHSPFEVKTIEESQKNGTENFFIHTVPIGKFFDARAKSKFQPSTRDGILLADSGEKEYQTDIYFRTEVGYRNQPIDY